MPNDDEHISLEKRFTMMLVILVINELIQWLCIVFRPADLDKLITWINEVNKWISQ